MESDSSIRIVARAGLSLFMMFALCSLGACFPDFMEEGPDWRAKGGDFVDVTESSQDPLLPYVMHLARGAIEESGSDLRCRNVGVMLENDLYYAVLFPFSPPPHEGIWVGEDVTVYIEKKRLKVVRILDNDWLSRHYSPCRDDGVLNQ